MNKIFQSMAKFYLKYVNIYDCIMFYLNNTHPKELAQLQLVMQVKQY